MGSFNSTEHNGFEQAQYEAEKSHSELIHLRAMCLWRWLMLRFALVDSPSTSSHSPVYHLRRFLNSPQNEDPDVAGHWQSTGPLEMQVYLDNITLLLESEQGDSKM